LEIKQISLKKKDDEITMETRKYFELKDNKTTTQKNLWNASPIVIQGNLYILNAYI